MPIRPWAWLTPCVILGIVPAAHGGAREFIVTPDNISEQLLVLRVETTTHDGGNVEFDVFVGAGTDSVFSNHNGQLQIGQWTTIHRSGKASVLAGPRFWCNLREDVEGDTLHYRFALPPEWVEDARFEFSNSPGGIALDIYRLPLKEFLVSR
jgi:hypothetical protein